MRNMIKARIIQFFLAVAILCVASLSAHASDTLSVYGFGSLNYDSNLFRFSSPSVAVARTGSTAMADYYKQFGYGASLRLPISQQLLTLDARSYEVLYSRNDHLNYQGSDNQGLYQWKAGRLLAGQIGFDNLSTMSSFDLNQQAVKNLRQVAHQFLKLEVDIAPKCVTEIGLDKRKTEFSSIFYKDIARNTHQFQASIKCYGHESNFLSLGLQTSTTEFPNRSFTDTSLLDNQYTENAVILVLNTRPKEFSRINADIRALHHKNEHLENRDYKGIDARVDYQQDFLDNASYTVSAWRDLNAIEAVDIDHVVKTGGGINSRIPLTAKLVARASLDGSLFQYYGNISQGQRKDGLITWNADLSYDVALYLNAAVGFSGGYRNSSNDLYDFRYRGLFVKFQATF